MNDKKPISINKRHTTIRFIPRRTPFRDWPQHTLSVILVVFSTIYYCRYCYYRCYRWFAPPVMRSSAAAMSTATTTSCPLCRTHHRLHAAATNRSLGGFEPANMFAMKQQQQEQQQQQQQQRTFYRRALPSDTCIALSSKAGKNRFQSAMNHHGLKSFFPLMEQHSTQSEPAFCGISSLAIALNAFAVDPRRTWKGPWRWFSETMLNCCIDLEDVQKNGITMATFKCLAQCQGLNVSMHYIHDDESSSSSSSTLEHFREIVKLACVEDETTNNNDDGNENGDAAAGDGGGGEDKLSHVLIVSYDRRVVGQTGSGHFSPIAAYDAASDSVLILDTARFKYGVHWIQLPLVYEAMKPIDPDSNRSRGYILLSKDEEDDTGSPDQSHHSLSTPSLPISVLLRTKMKQNPVRRKYKEFLDEKKKKQGRAISWRDVVGYWTRDFTDANYIWEMAEPQLRPCEEEIERIELIDQVRRLISDVMPPPVVMVKDQSETCNLNSSSASSSQRLLTDVCIQKCRPNLLRSLPLAPQEVIFMVYLASLDEEQRMEIVLSACDNFSPDKNNKGKDAYDDHNEDCSSSEKKYNDASGSPSDGFGYQTDREAAQKQLLAEAALLQLAIDKSVEIDDNIIS